MRLRKVYDQGGSGIGLWVIERDQDTGQLYLTTHVHTREPVTPELYAGWTGEMLDKLRQGLGRARVPSRIADAFIRQAQIRL